MRAPPDVVSFPDFDAADAAAVAQLPLALALCHCAIATRGRDDRIGLSRRRAVFRAPAIKTPAVESA